MKESKELKIVKYNYANSNSKDGTTIAYEKMGTGPAVILIDGAMCYRDSGPAKPLAGQLKDKYTVYIYDRRGRGESTNTLPYSIEKEVDDLEAVISETGDSVFVYAISSGVPLALETAKRNSNIKKLALYEVPFNVDNPSKKVPDNYVEQLNSMVESGNRSGAVKSFMKLVGVPGFIVMLMPLMPAWKNLISVAHTLPYDITLLGKNASGNPLDTSEWSNVKVPALVMGGGKSPKTMQNAQKALAEALPNAEHKTIEGQTHMLKAEVIAPVLKEYFND